MTKLARSGCRIAEVPVHHFHRMHGKSQFFNLRRVVLVLLRMLRLWWRLAAKRESIVSSAPREADDGAD
jgi:hypothetical protein